MMCDVCNNLELRDVFPNPQAYLDCLDYIKGLIESGDFEMESQTCDLDKVMDENGCFVDDIIGHTIVCKHCGQAFSCCVVTFRGSGSFRKGR